MKGAAVVGRGSDRGIVVSESRRFCGACGRPTRVPVRWEDGTLTWPCLRALVAVGKGYAIR